MNLHAAFAPPALIRNAHVQSVLSSLRLRRPSLQRRAAGLLAAAREHVLDCGDGVRLMGMHSSLPGAQRPLVMIFHGWEGSADSNYMLSLGSHLFENGYDVFRLNFRDHGPTHHLNRDIFHSCRIAEVVGATRAVQELFKPTSLSLAGFSLGGNFALRVAARAPDAGIKLHKAVAICPVLHPRKALDALESGWFIYERYFVSKWKNSLRLKQRCFPNDFDFTDILRRDTLLDMTDIMVEKYTDFPDTWAYLDGYKIVDNVLADLQVESHALLAADDPIIPVHDVQHLARTPHLNVVTIPRGGHCGFMDTIGSATWADRQVAAILNR
jgi:predicted alpha/beta-fold hydrolase